MPLMCNWIDGSNGIKMQWALDMSFETGDGVGTWPSGDGTGATGSNMPHNNMPPYLAVYMWKRVS
jgi:microcystin-dependent protein